MTKTVNHIHVHQQGGMKIVKKIKINNNRGYKSTTVYRHGKQHSSGKKPLTRKEIGKIKDGIFIPGLFKNLTTKKTNTMKTKTRKSR